MTSTARIKKISPGDFLTFKTTDNRHKVIFCVRTNRERSPQSFLFAATTFDGNFKPTVDDLADIDFWGKGNRLDFKYPDSDLERMWTYHPENKPYFLGIYGILILRKEFMKWRENFEIIANLSIVDKLEMNGSGDIYPGNFDNLDKLFPRTT
jgi:hypothetical protein